MGKNIRNLPTGADFDSSHFGMNAFRLGGPVMKKAEGGIVNSPATPNSGYASGGKVQKKAAGGPMMPMGGGDRAGALAALAGGQMPRMASPASAPQASTGMGGVMQRQQGQSPLVQAVVDAVMKGKTPKFAKGGAVKAPTSKGAGGDNAKTDVRSPTSTSTKTSTVANPRGNVTVTGGAGDGDTTVNVGKQKPVKLAKGGAVMKHPTKAKVVPKPKHNLPPKKALAKSPPAKKSGPNIAMNRPPQEPRDRTTPSNMMPGGEMPYGVQPSAMKPPSDIGRGRRIGRGIK